MSATVQPVRGTSADGSLPVTISSGGGGAVTIADGADIAEGAKADSAATNSSSSWTVVALLKGLYALLAGSLTVIQGTATNLKAQAEVYQGGTAVGAAAPLQVSLANTAANATAVAVSLATAPSTSVTQGTSPWVVGQSTATSLKAQAETYQGGTAVSASAPLFTKQQRAATPTQSSVADSASNVTLLAANANRLGATIYNDSTVSLYLKLGATASTSSFTVLMVANAYYEVPFNYTGIIDGIWASDASGSARITELVV